MGNIIAEYLQYPKLKGNNKGNSITENLQYPNKQCLNTEHGKHHCRIPTVSQQTVLKGNNKENNIAENLQYPIKQCLKVTTRETTLQKTYSIPTNIVQR